MKNIDGLSTQELLAKIQQKKEFSQIPAMDVEKVLGKFINKGHSDEEKIKLSRDLLRKAFSGFASQKILSIKEKDAGWILRKHLSTRERLSKYKEVYNLILDGMENKISVIDLGAGINGFSYGFFSEAGYEVDYTGVEGMKQLVDLMNHYFRKNGLNGLGVHLSLFNLGRIKNLVAGTGRPRVIFLFKTIDSLEMIEKNYSKKLLSEIAPLSDRVVVSFATRSMSKRVHFKATRNWINSFIRNRFNILNDRIIGNERYIIFSAN